MIYPLTEDPLTEYLPDWVIENTEVLIQVPRREEFG